MKKFFLGALVALASVITPANAFAQSYNFDGSNFTTVKTTSQATDQMTHLTYEVNGVRYPIYVTKNNKCYIKRVSKNTGKEYKQYLPAEVTAQVLKAIGR